MIMADDNNVIPLNSWKGKIQHGKSGPKKNMTNLMLHLRGIAELGNTIKLNEFSQRIEWNGRPLEDHDLIDIRMIMEAHDFDANAKDLFQAVDRHARENGYHPVRDYLRSLKWDGTPRLSHWLQLCLGADDTPFVQAAGRKTLISAVARAFKPGCKVDTMLVLEGPQGLKKSSAIAALFSETWTGESVNLFDQHNKMVMTMMGSWVVELAEFVAIQRRDQNTVKGMISMQSDRVVLSYAKIASDHPRQCIFMGTINPEEFGYLTDGTGNRRYWPIRCTKIDLDLIKARRDQIWAEAYRAYLNDEAWWLDADEEALARDQAAEREESDPWEEVLGEKLSGIARTTITTAMNMLSIPAERQDRKARDRIAKTLRRLGFIVSAKPSKDENRKSVRFFIRDL